MNIEKVEFDHFKNIEELIEHLEMWYAEDDYYAYDRYFGLRDARIMGMYIYQLQQENQELKNSINALQKELNEENLQCSKYAIENQELKKIVELCSKSLYNVELTKYKEVIDKIFNYLEDNYGYSCVKGIINDTDVSKLYDILKEVE